jgi:hypothetical protein
MSARTGRWKSDSDAAIMSGMTLSSPRCEQLMSAIVREGSEDTVEGIAEIGVAGVTARI